MMTVKKKSITQVRNELIDSLKEQYGDDAEPLAIIMLRYEKAKQKWKARKRKHKFLLGTPKMSRIARKLNAIIRKHEPPQEEKEDE